MATSLCKKALNNKIGCNRLLLVNPPAAAAAAATMGLNQQQHKVVRNNNLQIRFPFSTRTVFNDWCKEHGKKYSSEKIEKLAFKNFEENYRIASEHNVKDNSSLLGLTHIMDRCPEFWRPKFMASKLIKDRDEEGDGVGPVIECRSVKEWKKHFKKGTKSGKLVVVDFSNEYLISSGAIDPKYAEENADRGILFLKVDLLKLQSVAKEFNVEYDEPTFLFLKDGVEMGRLSSRVVTT